MKDESVFVFRSNSVSSSSLYPILESRGLVEFLVVRIVYSGTLKMRTFENPFNDQTVTVRMFEYSDFVTQSA